MIVTMLITIIALQVLTLVSQTTQFRALAKPWWALGRDIKEIIENTKRGLSINRALPAHLKGTPAQSLEQPPRTAADAPPGHAPVWKCFTDGTRRIVAWIPIDPENPGLRYFA